MGFSLIWSPILKWDALLLAVFIEGLGRCLMSFSLWVIDYSVCLPCAWLNLCSLKGRNPAGALAVAILPYFLEPAFSAWTLCMLKRCFPIGYFHKVKIRTYLGCGLSCEVMSVTFTFGDSILWEEQILCKFVLCFFGAPWGRCAVADSWPLLNNKSVFLYLQIASTQ